MDARIPAQAASFSSSDGWQTGAALVSRLREAILSRHECEARFVGAVPVRETFHGEVIWEGEVQVFDLIPEAPAPRCYAWVEETEGEIPEIATVLHGAGIDSPALAVRAHILLKALEATKVKAVKKR
jgi:hypothetical protein